METYEVLFNEKQDKGVYALSVVEEPAMQGNFIALNKQEEVKLAEVDKEQQILMGVALIPDKLIYRNQGGKEFNITFSSNTIKQIAHAFLKNGYQGNSTIEHDEKISGVSVVESWIIEDEVNDKSRKYGFDYPVGSWMATMKVDNQELWNDYVKTGKIKGFSIDGLFSLNKVNLSVNMEEQKENSTNLILNAIQEIKALFSKKEEIKLGKAKLDNDATIEFDGDELRVGIPVYVESEGERVALPDGEYRTVEGFEFKILDGLVVEKEEEIKEEIKEELSTDNSSAIDELKQLVASLKSEVETFKSEKETELSLKNQKIEDLEKELENTPASTPIVHTMELANVEAKTTKARILQTINKHNK